MDQFVYLHFKLMVQINTICVTLLYLWLSSEHFFNFLMKIVSYLRTKITLKVLNNNRLHVKISDAVLVLKRFCLVKRTKSKGLVSLYEVVSVVSVLEVTFSIWAYLVQAICQWNRIPYLSGSRRHHSWQ